MKKIFGQEIKYKRLNDDGDTQVFVDGMALFALHRGWSRLGGTGWMHNESSQSFRNRDEATRDWMCRTGMALPETVRQALNLHGKDSNNDW